MDPFHPQIMKFVSSAADPKCWGKRYGELVDGVLRFTGKTKRKIFWMVINSKSPIIYRLSIYPFITMHYGI